MVRMPILSSVLDLGIRAANAMDPRWGDGWGPMRALRTPLLIVGAILVDVAVYGYHVPVSDALTGALNLAAVAVLGHDTGALSKTA